MTLFLSILLAFTMAVLLVCALNTYSRTVTNDWARALKWVAVVLIFALAAVMVAERIVA